MTSELETCPVCGEGKLYPTFEIRTFSPTHYPDIEITGRTEYSVCDICESEVANGDQIDRNAQVVKDAINGKL